MAKHERKVIEAFVENRQPGRSVDEWPDEINRNSREIDAIAGRFAIEHTSIDTLTSQRERSAWFMEVTGGLREELLNRISFRLRITLEYEAIQKGPDWTALRGALKTWIISESPKLPDGNHKLNSINGVHFPLSISKASDRPAGVYFSRFEPNDNTIASRIKELFKRKADKLAKYSTKVKVLLVENNNLTLMNIPTMIDAIENAFQGGLPQGVDQIWYADTSILSEIEFVHIR